MPGINPDGYGDWRDTPITDTLRCLRGALTAVLLRLGLIEFQSVEPTPHLRLVRDGEGGTEGA
jgi:hypothetical protein